MKIVELRAENFKRLRAVDISPDGHLQVVAGRNAQGKTSVLDAIWHALSYADAKKGTAKPIRDGADKAVVRLDLGDLIVTRTWTSDSRTTLKVESADGASYRSPQAMLDALVGQLSFDPLAYSDASDKVQLETLLGLVELPFDPDDLAAERRGLYEQRTDVGRRVKEYAGQVAGMADVDLDVPETEVSASEVLAQIQAAQEHNRLHATYTQQANGIDDEIIRKVREYEALSEQIRGLKQESKDARDRLRALSPAADIEPLQQQLADLERTNASVRAAAKAREVRDWHDSAHRQYDDLTKQIAGLDDLKADALTSAVMPIDGLGFDDDGVTYQGVPFRQCSGAERLRVSLAMAMALNPELRVIRITDGSLLDSTNLALVEEMAREHDFQVWVERVDETGAMGVVIEDGQVAS